MEFLKELQEIPSFENRERGDGYAFNLEDIPDISNIIIKTLITKFLNQRFCKTETDLNSRANSLEKTTGFYKWNVKDIITHLETARYF